MHRLLDRDGGALHAIFGDDENMASIRLFERLGFQREGLLRANWKTHIGVRHSVIMGLIDIDPRVWK